MDAPRKGLRMRQKDIAGITQSCRLPTKLFNR